VDVKKMTKLMVAPTKNPFGAKQDIVDTWTIGLKAASSKRWRIFDDSENPFVSSPNFTEERVEADYNLIAQLMFSVRIQFERRGIDAL
jgi:hypothetical protein